MGVKNRLRSLMDEKSMTIQSFSEFIGVPKGTFEKYLNSERLPSAEAVLAIRSKMGVSADWLLGGFGPQYLGVELPKESASSGHPDFIPIPRFGVDASAGQGRLPGDEETTGFYAFNKRWLARRGLNPDHLAIISVRGDSMEPGFCDNDLILVDQAQTRPIDGLVFVFRVATDLFVKHVQTMPDGTLQLLSANKLYPPMPVDTRAAPEDFKVIGRVVASMHEW